LIHFSNVSAKMYFPFQPEIQQSTIGYQELKPIGGQFCDDIALYYQFKTKKETPTFLSLIPDGCFDILFCCSPKKPKVFLWTSPYFRRKQPKFEIDCEYFGVRFFPEQTIILLEYSMRELLDKQIPLLDVLAADASIADAISEGKSFLERIALFEKFLKVISLDMNNDQKIVAYAIQKIYDSKGILNMKQLARYIGYSEQYIRKQFEAYIGFSPKQFCQIVQFQNSLDMFIRTENLNLLDIIYKNGYYDQSHFIKAFKKFVRLTPKQYKENFLNFM